MESEKRDSSYPKEVRLLRPSDFQKIYAEGFRVSGPYFAAFCLAVTGQSRPRIGLTVPRTVGKSVVRNRLRRRLREAVRLNLCRLGPQWAIVLNPRRPALNAPLEDLRREVEKLFLRCRG